MRVRPKQKNSSSRRAMPGPTRRSHARPKPNGAPPQEFPAEPAIPIDSEHPDEQRARLSGGPLDTAHYACECGYCFDAAVSTTVTCPHCGTGQAW